MIKDYKRKEENIKNKYVDDKGKKDEKNRNKNNRIKK